MSQSLLIIQINFIQHVSKISYCSYYQRHAHDFYSFVHLLLVLHFLLLVFSFFTILTYYFIQSEAQELETVKMSSFSGSQKKNDKLKSAANIHVKIGHMQRYCELMVEIGEVGLICFTRSLILSTDNVILIHAHNMRTMYSTIQTLLQHFVQVYWFLI